LLKFPDASVSHSNEISINENPILIDPDEQIHYLHGDERMRPPRHHRRYIANHVFNKLASIGPTRLSCHFGQWPTQIIPKIYFLLKYTPNDVPILVPECVSKFKDDMVRYGIWPKNRKYIIQKRDHLYKAKEVFSYFVPASHKVHRTVEMVPHLVQEMHEILLKSMKEKPQDYILIPLRNIHPDPSKDHEGGHSRKIDNLPELMKRLKEEFPEYKVKTVAPHLLSNYYEQGRLFYHAKLIITPHSASESNLIWTRKGTKIIEAQWEQFAAIQFYCLSRILGQDWGTVLSKSNYQKTTTMPVEDIILMAKKLLKK
jgi:glycosyltransferase involved in cell wall biosynthesis